MKEFPTFQPFGEHAFLINWEAKIKDEIHQKVLKMETFLNENFKKEIVETVPTYHSLAVFLKLGSDINSVINNVEKKYSEAGEIHVKNSVIVKVPVCYDEEFAPDLKYLATFHNISEQKVIKLHTRALYKIYFLGFLPGFPYLGGLPKMLHTPRRKTPRQEIQKGSVAIGGGQAGIYTIPSPGGWHIIGKSPLQFFNVEKKVPVLLKPGDYIRFHQIDKRQMEQMEADVALGKYVLEKEEYNG